MTKTERLKKNGLKAGIKKSKKEGHVLSKEELLEMKVQVMPSLFRWISGILGVVGIGYAVFVGEFSILFLLLGLLLLVCGIYGYRKTLSKVVDGLGDVGGEVVVEVIFDGVVGAVGSIFD